MKNSTAAAIFSLWAPSCTKWPPAGWRLAAELRQWYSRLFSIARLLSAARINPELIPDLGWIAAKLLEKDRKLRYQSASELQADLKRVKRDTESSGVPTFTAPKGLQSPGVRQVSSRP